MLLLFITQQNNLNKIVHTSTVFYTTKYFVAESEALTLLTTKPATGHDTESYPSTSDRHNLYL